MKKLVGNLFDCQPKYLNDFRLCSSTMIDAFQQVSTELESFLQSRKETTTLEFEDLVMSCVDLSTSLASLLEAHPAVLYGVFQSSNSEFTVRLANFYHQCLTAMHERISNDLYIKEVTEESAHFLLCRILLAKSTMLKVVRKTIIHCILVFL